MSFYNDNKTRQKIFYPHFHSNLFITRSWHLSLGQKDEWVNR